MATKVIEFSEKYPKYNRGFLAYNEKTDSEKLIGKRASLVYDPNNHREYQEFLFKEEIFSSLMNIFKEEHKVYSFAAYGDNDPISFVGVRRGDSIYAVCLKTCERVILRQDNFIDRHVKAADLMLSI